MKAIRKQIEKLSIEACDKLKLEIEENTTRIFNETKANNKCVCGHNTVSICAVMKQIAYNQIYDREYKRILSETLNKIKENKRLANLTLQSNSSN
jgi:hypothetical protein